MVKVTLLFAVALLALPLLRRASAATRHALLVSAQVAALSLPLLVGVMPAVNVPHTDEVLNVGWASARPIARAPGGRAEARPTFAHVWVAGTLVVMIVKLVGLARAVRIVRRAKNGVSGEIDQPMTFGRHVLLPASSSTWTDERRKAVMLHEQAHVARHDTLLALAGDLACAVYWFHPLAWLTARKARLERERACDDAVLAAGVAADEYASAIVDIARGMRRAAMAMPMAAPSQLETRIVAILDPRVARRTSSAWIAVVAMFTIAPVLAAVEGDIARPRFDEPDLRRDSPPQSELLPPVAAPRVEARGPDAELIAILLHAASRAPQHSIDYVPERARWALRQIENGELVPPLLEALEDRDWRVRAYAAWALGYSADARATRPIVKMLEDDRWRVRAMAAHALASLADPAAEEAMLAAIDDEAWQVRSAVAQYLANRGVHQATLRALRGDRHVMVRMIAEEGLR